jgi:hypothetical protein
MATKTNIPNMPNTVFFIKHQPRGEFLPFITRETPQSYHCFHFGREISSQRRFYWPGAQSKSELMSRHITPGPLIEDQHITFDEVRSAGNRQDPENVAVDLLLSMESQKLIFHCCLLTFARPVVYSRATC